MTLNVDFGDHVETFEYSAPADHKIRDVQFHFCNNSFKRSNWHYYHYDDDFYFKRKKDLMWFKLRFGT